MDPTKIRTQAMVVVTEGAILALMEFCPKLAEHLKMTTIEAEPAAFWLSGQMLRTAREQLAMLEDHDPKLAATVQEFIDAMCKKAGRAVGEDEA
jgi:hypothetical protein